MRFLGLVLLAALVVGHPAAADENEMTLYKITGCGCCDGHADYLRQHGFQVRSVELSDLSPVRAGRGIPEKFEGCHLIEVGGYVIEGHVPIGSIRKLLSERPAIKGISLPGMPAGSPGMGGPKTEPFVIYEISQGEPKVFAVE